MTETEKLQLIRELVTILYAADVADPPLSKQLLAQQIVDHFSRWLAAQPPFDG